MKKRGAYLASVMMLIVSSSTPSQSNNATSSSPEFRALADKCTKLRGEERISACTDAIRLNPNDPVNYYNRGYEFRKQNDLDRALADFNELIRLEPNYSDNYFARGIVWYEKNIFSKAIKDFSQAIQLDEKNAKAYGNRGLVFTELGQFDRAIADFEQALKLNPDYSQAKQNLQYAQEQQKVKSCKPRVFSSTVFTGTFVCTDEVMSSGGVTVSQGRDRGISSVRAVLDSTADNNAYIMEKLFSNGVVCLSHSWSLQGDQLAIEAEYSERGGGQIVRFKDTKYWSWINRDQMCE